MKRAHISLKTKLAAALLALENIPFTQAQRMTDDEIIALYHFDHWPIPHAHGGPDVAWNLVPMLAADHQAKTAKLDIPQIAKTKRISKEQQEFIARILTPRDLRPQKKSKWPSRPFKKKEVTHNKKV